MLRISSQYYAGDDRITLKNHKDFLRQQRYYRQKAKNQSSEHYFNLNGKKYPKMSNVPSVAFITPLS